jgi:hypothetical protein
MSTSTLKRKRLTKQKDLGEYNQCQTMLRQLYELGLKGHPQEFLSYRIIYLLHTRNRSGMSSTILPTSTSSQDLVTSITLHSPPRSSTPRPRPSSRPLLDQALQARSRLSSVVLSEQTSLTRRYGSPPSPTHPNRKIRSRSPPRTPNTRITSNIKLRPFLSFIQYCTQHVGVYIGSFCGEGTDECFDYYVQGVSLFLLLLCSFSCPVPLVV